MAWYIVDRQVKDGKGNDICILEDSLDPYYANLITNVRHIVKLIGEFVIGHDEGKKMTKTLYNEFNWLIDMSKEYNFKWRMNLEGDVEDEQGRLICAFPTNNSTAAGEIKCLPEMLQAIKELIDNFNRNKPLQKPTYDKFCKIYDLMNE